MRPQYEIGITQVFDGGELLALILRHEYEPTKTEFATPPDLSLQVGHIVYPEGGSVAPHRHRSVVRTITTTGEALFVKRGRAHADFFGSDGGLLETHEVETGDVLVLFSGGHGFRMIEDTVLVEIKQGPYAGVDEKEYL
jgi:hypothetical protein